MLQPRQGPEASTRRQSHFSAYRKTAGDKHTRKTRQAGGCGESSNIGPPRSGQRKCMQHTCADKGKTHASTHNFNAQTQTVSI